MGSSTVAWLASNSTGPVRGTCSKPWTWSFTKGRRSADAGRRNTLTHRSTFARRVADGSSQRTSDTSQDYRPLQA
jgi:hypothetical protein